jgi:hypothetical protein
MSARRKTPTADDHKRTAIFESGKHRRPGAAGEFPEHVDPTVVDGPLAQSLNDGPAPAAGGTTIVDPPSHATPTVLGKPAPAARAPLQVISKKDPSSPIQVISKKQGSSAPIQAISMKSPSEPAAAQGNQGTPMLARPKLRAMSEITPVNQQNLGHVAPPYDPEAARARKVREYVIWGCVAVILASAIALVVWFVAR